MTVSATLTLPVLGGRAARPSVWRLLIRKPLAVASIVVLLVIVLACVFASSISPYDPLLQDLSAVLQPPSAAHPLGTDTLGRDVLSRLLHGGLTTLVAVAQAVVVAAIVGPALGMWAGYRGGAVDRVVSGYLVTMMAIPTVILLLSVFAVFPDNLSLGMAALGLLGATPIAWAVRAGAKATAQESFVTAAELAGVGGSRMLWRHFVPRLNGVIVIQLAMFACIALVMQGGLAFLGLGVTPPAPSWGGGIAEAQKVIFISQWLFVPYGGVLGLTVLALALLGDAVRDAVAEVSSLESRTARPRRRAAVVRRAPSSTPPAPDALLSIRDATIAYDGRSLPVVDGVSLDVAEGEIVGVVGESGSGKSTLMLSLLALLPGTATVVGGTATIGGQDLYALDARRMRALRGREIGMIAQEPMSALDPAYPVGRLLDEIVRVHGAPAGLTVRQRSHELLRSVRLDDPERVCRLYPFELSGGMAQRVCIAMALAGSPRLLIADEATASLDVTVQATILDLLRSLAEERRMSVLVVTHNLGVVADLCDSVVVMRQGVVVAAGDVDSVFYDVHDDYVAELLAATPSLLPASVAEPNPGEALT
ncbi:MAG: dipeptide/oligopeptide/nickel ABC transporter permease/ATP-binding protein [Microbacterium sp.]|uniref:dipeptide/oligopeptide/nickel ABC transporter permease/ATP-binding protein n=1 Tax=Microbacterium sp. TaxID=51671 RepID=UPI0039E38D94